MDLATFLNARLDEDEAAAKLAISMSSEANPVQVPTGRWRATQDVLTAEAGVLPGTGADFWEIGDGKIPIVDHVPYEGGGIYCWAVAEHIARHDPARVLREVQATRTILARYERNKVGMKDRSRLERAMAPTIAVVLESALADLAAVYSDHPDYDPAWAT